MPKCLRQTRKWTKILRNRRQWWTSSIKTIDPQSWGTETNISVEFLIMRSLSCATPKKSYKLCIPMSSHSTAEDHQGLRAIANPNLGFLSKALVSISPEIVSNDFGMTSCCRSAASLPWLLSFAFTTVR